MISPYAVNAWPCGWYRLKSMFVKALKFRENMEMPAVALSDLPE